MTVFKLFITNKLVIIFFIIVINGKSSFRTFVFSSHFFAGIGTEITVET